MVRAVIVSVAILFGVVAVPDSKEPPHTELVVIPATTTTTLPVMPHYEEWTRVAMCEEGGWINSSGSVYPDSLGISSDNWYAFGGGNDYSPAAQIAVAERFIAAYGIGIPDQNGCAPW